MSQKAISFTGSVALFGNGDARTADLADARARSMRILAADGGANWLAHNGQRSELIIGDLDSVKEDVRNGQGEDELIHILEQDSTDFDKSLAAISAPLVLAYGFLGGRVDHQLANLSSLVRAHEKAVILVGEHDACAHIPDAISLDLPVGTRLSLYPMREVRGHATGLRYPIEGLTFSPAAQIGTSNEANAPNVRLSFDSHGMLLILPRAQLDALIDGLLAQ